MLKKKITAILVSVGMIFTVGAPTMMAHAEQLNKAPITHMATRQATSQMAVVNSRVAVMQGAKVIGYANKYDMATIISTNGNVCNVVTEFGLQGQINKSDLNMVQSGVNQPLQTMKKEGHVTNVTTVLNVRTEPTTASSIKAQLTNNTNFEIIGQQGDWLKINVGNETGFVFNEFASEGHSNVGGRVITGSEINSMATTQGATYGSVQNNNVATSSATTNSSVATTNSSVSSARASESNGSKIVTTGTTTSKTTVKSNTGNKVTKTSPSVKETSSKSTSSSKVKHKEVDHNTPVSNKSEHHSTVEQNTPVNSTTQHHATVDHNTPVNNKSEHHSTVEHNTPANTQGQDSNKRQPEGENNNQSNQTAPAKGQSQVKTGYTYMPQLSQEVFNGINQLREQAGQKALEYSSSDNSQAMSLALQMAKAGNADHSYNEMGAMCAEGNANYIVNMFKNSPEHYSQLTQSTIDKGAVAVYRNNKTGLYFTAVQFTIANATNNTWHNM